MIGAIFRLIVLSELLANLVGSYAHNRVLPTVKILGKLKQLDTNRTFLQRAGRTVQRVFNDVVQELAAPLAGAKRRALL